MANSWLRLWHDMPNDPKWRTIARKSGQSIGNVMAVYLHVLVNASSVTETQGNAGVTQSNACKRGVIKNLCADDVASSLDLDPEQVEQILSAMQGKVLDGDAVTGWAKRQPKREDDSAARVRASRDRRRAMPLGGDGAICPDVTQGNAGVTQSNAPDKDTDTEKDTDLKPENTLVHGEKIASEPAQEFSDVDSPDYPKADPTLSSEADSDAAGKRAPKNRDAGYPEEFERVWREYPGRAGANPKKSAYSAWHARRREGISPDVMLDGVRRYVNYLQVTGKGGTEFVQRASTFFGPDRNFENAWKPPSAGSIHQISPPETTIPDGFRG